jgi:hypothetical protein
MQEIELAENKGYNTTFPWAEHHQRMRKALEECERAWFSMMVMMMYGVAGSMEHLVGDLGDSLDRLHHNRNLMNRNTDDTLEPVGHLKSLKTERTCATSLVPHYR